MAEGCPLGENSTSRSLRKGRTVVLLALTIALGLLSRHRPIGWYFYDKSLGDALYAVAGYLTLALLFSRRPPSFIATTALALCVAVELFKFTGLPAALAHLPVLPWVLGYSFSWHNLACYLLGVGFAAVLDHLALRTQSVVKDAFQGESVSP
jgi:hypothetical protein